MRSVFYIITRQFQFPNIDLLPFMEQSCSIPSPFLKKVGCTFLLSLLFTFLSSAQIKVSGTIKDASNNEPLIGVNILIEGSKGIGTVTNVEPNNANEWKAYPQFPNEDTPIEGGIPYNTHRDNNYSIKGDNNFFSPFNYYLIRDEKDIPEIILTAAEMKFIIAEAYLRGLGVPQNTSTAEGECYVGVVASINFWQNIVTNTGRWINQPIIYTESEVYALANDPNLSIFETEDKLAHIYKQRWLDALRQPWEVYALMRRTSGQTPLEGNLPEHYRFPYPPSETINNPDEWLIQVDRMGEDSKKIKVWWME